MYKPPNRLFLGIFMRGLMDEFVAISVKRPSIVSVVPIAIDLSSFCAREREVSASILPLLIRALFTTRIGTRRTISRWAHRGSQCYQKQNIPTMLSSYHIPTMLSRPCYPVIKSISSYAPDYLLTLNYNELNYCCPLFLDENPTKSRFTEVFTFRLGVCVHC